MERSETVATCQRSGNISRRLRFCYVKKGIVLLKDPEPPSTVLRTRLLEAFREHRFLLAAFLIPLCIRAIPEILVGPYPVGWDTIAFYVPNTLDWATGRLGWVALLGTAPLLYMISVPVYLMTRANPVWIFKIMGPILYGGLILALYRLLRLGLRWVGRPGLLFFLLVGYPGVILPGGSLVQQQASVPGLDSVVCSAGFLRYIDLPIAPLVFLGLRRIANTDLRNWTVVLLGLALT